MSNNAEQMRRQFVQDYPKEHIKDLTWDEYVIGHGKESHTFCYRLEHELGELGSVRGNSSGKFGVWYGTHKGSKEGRQFNAKFGDNPDSAFECVKDEIVRLIKAGEKNDTKAIKSSKFGPMVRGKILYVYFPDKFLPIYSMEHLEFFIDKLGCSVKVRDQFTMQKALIKYHDKYRQNETYLEFIDSLYKAYNPNQTVSNDDYDEEETNGKISRGQTNADEVTVENYKDEPIEKIGLMKRNGEKYYPRTAKYSMEALALANYSCEYCAEHKSFEKASDGRRYTEAHHLIPLSRYGEFQESLDNPANIVSLCSECHNRLHYGKDKEEMLKTLYEQRKDRLKKAEIEVDFDKLLGFYDIKGKRGKKK